MSSRNLRLGGGARATAPVLGRVLESAANVIGRGGNVSQALETAHQALLVAGFDKVDYFELRSDPGLLAIETADQPARLLAAAWLNGVRLIDNLPIPMLTQTTNSAQLCEPA